MSAGRNVNEVKIILTVRQRVDVELANGFKSVLHISRRQPTYDPEKPPFHLADGDHVSDVLDHVGHEERTDPERGVEARVHETEAPEEALHR